MILFITLWVFLRFKIFSLLVGTKIDQIQKSLRELFFQCVSIIMNFLPDLLQLHFANNPSIKYYVNTTIKTVNNFPISNKMREFRFISLNFSRASTDLLPFSKLTSISVTASRKNNLLQKSRKQLQYKNNN